MAGAGGIEPPHGGIKIPRSNLQNQLVTVTEASNPASQINYLQVNCLTCALTNVCQRD